MQRVGYFDADGNCLCILTGDMEPPAIDYAFSADVADGIGPNSAVYDKAKGKVKDKGPRIIPAPVVTGPTLEERVAQLEQQVQALQDIVQP